MATDPKRDGEEDSESGNSTIDLIKLLCAHNARADLNTSKQLLLFLQSWWSRTYNRPLKDPLLMSYTLEELVYEFYDRVERNKAAEEQVKLDSDKIEEEQEKAALDWAEQEEKKEEQAVQAAEHSTSIVTQDPVKDPENIAWMEQQLQKAKQQYGETFGDDIEESFED